MCVGEGRKSFVCVAKLRWCLGGQCVCVCVSSCSMALADLFLFWGACGALKDRLVCERVGCVFVRRDWCDEELSANTVLSWLTAWFCAFEIAVSYHRVQLPCRAST